MDDADFTMLNRILRQFGQEVIRGDFLLRDGTKSSFYVDVIDPQKMLVAAAKLVGVGG